MKVKKLAAYLAIAAGVFLAGFVWGIAVQKYKTFPYEAIRFAYCAFQQVTRPHGPWSIGIFGGGSLFDLHDIDGVTNPVLTAEHVTDMDALCIADPFIVDHGGRYYMFFEAVERKERKGVIAYAESTDAKAWRYGKVVIREGFHLSYPYVFRWRDDYYLVPESQRDFSVRLYKAVRFPDTWCFIGKILSGYKFADPSVFRYGDRWWLFASAGSNDALNLYWSADLLKGWQPHPMNPVVKLNRHFSRCGGRVVVDGGRLFRLTQDDDPVYGKLVFAFEITLLSEMAYAERLASPKPIVKGSGRGWNAAGMHHVDPHKTHNGWIAAVDGKAW